MQIVAYPMKREVYERLLADRWRMFTDELVLKCESPISPVALGLAAGGKMRQEIYEDPYDADVWDLDTSSRCFVTILDATAWASITGERPPTRPITAEQYRRAGIPWFDYYAADQQALAGSPVLAKVKSFEEALRSGLDGASDIDEAGAAKVRPIGPDRRPNAPRLVREM